MYEIGKVYVWRNQVGDSASVNGMECVPDEPACRYRNTKTNVVVWGQHVTNADGGKWIAVRGDLYPKVTKPGEQIIADILRGVRHVAI